MRPTNSQALAQWIKDNFNQTWPWPTATNNFADLIVAPISTVIASWWQRPSGWISTFGSWLTGRANTYGLSSLVGLGIDDASALLAEWYEEHCDANEVPPYEDWQEPVQEGG